jgi:hypothetical protein
MLITGIYKEANFETKFNQVNHEFEVYLDSGFGETEVNRYPINPNSIVNLSIEDTLADWITRGTLTFLYNPESGSGISNPATGNDRRAETGVNFANDLKPFYTPRNDGYDLLRVRVKPVLNNNQDLPNATIITDPVHWSLSYLFSIYDVEDIDLPPGAQGQASSSIKCLKLYFWDSWYQKMLTNKLEYSSALSPFSNIDRDIQEGVYDNPGVLPTGQIIREIINLSLGTNSTQENYSNTTYVDPTLNFNYEPIRESEWEDGSSEMFFTTPAGSTAFESLMYVYKNHASGDSYSVPPKESAPRGGTPDAKLYDLSLLKKERGPDEYDVGQLTLQSMSSIFQKAGSGSTTPGPYQNEHFFLQSYTDVQSRKPTKTLRGPISNDNSSTVDFKSLKYSVISNYRFVDISALTNTTEFVNTPVYSFNFKERAFNIEFNNNSVTTARKFMSEKYIKNVYKDNGADLEKLFLINLDKDRENKNVNPRFSLAGDNPVIRQKTGLHRLLYYGLFQNAAINFRTLGLSFREPGRFIAIDKTEGVEDGDFEDKFYGQWFVINVKHIFESEIYYNDITAIKIHRFQEASLNLPGTL